MQKIILSDPKTGKSYSIELETERTKTINGTKTGNTIDATSIGLPGYEIQITGGSDKDGFPMRVDVPRGGRKKVLLSGGPCYRPKSKGIKRRKTVRGNVVTQDIVQINAKIVKKGTKSIEKLLGMGKGEKAVEGEKVAKEEKPPEDEKVAKGKKSVKKEKSDEGEKSPKEEKPAKGKKPAKEKEPDKKEKPPAEKKVAEGKRSAKEEKPKAEED